MYHINFDKQRISPATSDTVGATMTVPGLSVPLSSLVTSAIDGSPIPMRGRPLYDDSPESGQIRVKLDGMDSAELKESAEAIRKQNEDAKQEAQQVQQGTQQAQQATPQADE